MAGFPVPCVVKYCVGVKPVGYETVSYPPGLTQEENTGGSLHCGWRGFFIMQRLYSRGARRRLELLTVSKLRGGLKFWGY